MYDPINILALGIVIVALGALGFSAFPHRSG